MAQTSVEQTDAAGNGFHMAGHGLIRHHMIRWKNLGLMFRISLEKMQFFQHVFCCLLIRCDEEQRPLFLCRQGRSDKGTGRIGNPRTIHRLLLGPEKIQKV